jgi:cell division protein FtsB
MMRTLTDREKRTVRYAAIFIVVYLALFFRYAGKSYLETKRKDYQQLVAEAQDLRSQVRRYQDKAAHVKKLMEDSNLDPARLTRPNVVAEASAAIQNAATAARINVGPVREGPPRASAGELGSVQFEGSGSVPAIMGLIHQLEGLGYPLLIESVELTQDPMRQGQVKVNLTVEVLDFDQWKPEATPHA